MYNVMKNKPENVGGFELISTALNKAEAERIARDHDRTYKGKPIGLTRVWSRKEYDDWHEAEVMPFYR